MNCDELRQLYDAYLDSELDAKTTLEMQEHLATCGECARLLAAEAKMDARLTTSLRQGRRTAALWEQIERQVVAASEFDTRSSALPPRSLGWLATLNSQLSTLLWPHPKAWAGLAAVWVVILAVNFATRETNPVLEARRATPPMSQTPWLLKEREQLLAELSGQPALRDADRPKKVPPRPRTQRRDELLKA